MSQTESQPIEPKRQSLFQKSKNQIANTKGLFLNRFKSNSNDQAAASEPATLSSVELPQIEQLQPIDTTIAQNEQSSQQEKNEKEEQDDNVVAPDQKEKAENDEQQQNDTKEDDKEETEEQVVAKENEDQVNEEIQEEKPSEENGNSDEDITANSNKKENETPTKRTSLIQKWFKKSNKPTIDTTKKNDEEKEPENLDAPKAVDQEHKVTKPSSPLGRKFNELLSRLPSKKEKKQATEVTSEKVQVNEPSDVIVAAA
ncbi:hypothetical protein BJ944DRAFT_272498 [Cunninghamella echinulata]|nr:hypothetical protein BJ944DRAFT_272498 [Cunninghamella echinulata]